MSAHGVSPGVKVGLVLLVIALLHVGAWLLLTAGARRDVRSLEARYGRHELVVALAPGPQPVDAAKLRAWSRKQERWEARDRWMERRDLVSILRNALLASFVIQAGFILMMSYKVLSRPPRR